MSSSAPTEPKGDPVRASGARRPPQLPILLGVAAILAVLLIVAAVISLLGQGSPATKGLPPSRLVGQPVPAAMVEHLPLVGKDGSLGVPWGHGHGAVLLFFARWCSVCHAEVHRLAHELGLGDVGTVHVVGLDGDGGPNGASIAAGFVAASGVRFPVALDLNLQVASALVPDGFPATVFVRPSGRVAAVDYGAITTMQLSAGLSQIGHA
ncbi:MAG TPA: TlpA family protein disulfide reductase [Acidimicrobiales bacterium]|jgi:hypothetical protein|nr:TlpA family protein disulfide reductase [Acidimicrobiales bacterium]